METVRIKIVKLSQMHSATKFLIRNALTSDGFLVRIALRRDERKEELINT